MDEIKSAILSIIELDKADFYRSAAEREKLAELAGRLDLDLSHEHLHLEAGESKPTGHDILAYCRVAQGVFRIIELLQELPPQIQDDIIIWMLQSESMAIWGAGVYRLSPRKTEAVFQACFLGALLTEDPSFNRDFIEPCIFHKGRLEFIRAIHSVAMNSDAPDEQRAGVYNSLYWSGLDFLPNLKEYDQFLAQAEEKLRTDWASIQFPSQHTEYYAGTVNHKRQKDYEKYLRYKKLTREEIIELERIRRDLANLAVDLFLDESRSIELRKQTYGRIPLNHPELLTPERQARLRDVVGIAKYFHFETA
ncbi:hypothetical protein HY256_06550 [Candidatus Sumerlaeota bacterium]|nr:hypothetical protein [Candidatus Sumerlaeota bacterium]